MYALNPISLEFKLEWEGKKTHWGINDDYLLNDKNEIVDLQASEQEWQPVLVSSICKTQRARQSGAYTSPQEFSIPFVIECGMNFKIANDDLVIFETKSQHGEHGVLLRSF